MDASRPRNRMGQPDLPGRLDGVGRADVSRRPRADVPGRPRADVPGRPRADVPGRLDGPRRRRALIVTALPVAAIDGMLWAGAAETFAVLPPAYWLMAALAVVVDARPYVLADRRARSVILPSICFTFAIALAWGFAPAV